MQVVAGFLPSLYMYIQDGREKKTKNEKEKIGQEPALHSITVSNGGTRESLSRDVDCGRGMVDLGPTLLVS
jgi:hypothetical protein